MRDPDFGWEYPPGVTGNEPQITGEWPDDEEPPEQYDTWQEKEDAER